MHTISLLGNEIAAPRGFGSDNQSGAIPEALAALAQVNAGHVPSYGADAVTLAAEARFRELFGDVDVYFVFNGTAANVLCLQTATRPYEAVVCADTAHVHVDECGAPERFLGSKVITVRGDHGKLSPELIEPFIIRRGDQHFAQPRVISISEPTELGTIYTPEELRRLADFAHQHAMYLHIDGARLVNAAAALDTSLRALTTDIGADIVSFGGTKNGLVFGEAVLVLNPTLRRDVRYMRKQAMQLFSKSRFVAAQFLALLDGERWRHYAKHANAMAKRLGEALTQQPKVKLSHPVQANAVFALLPRELMQRARERYFFYVWDEKTLECRFMCTFDTTEEDVDGLVRALAG